MHNAQKLNFVSLMHDFVRTQAQNHFHDLPKKLPCHVSAIKGNNGQGDFYELTFDVVNSVFTLPKIVVPQTFSKYKREPTQVGDKGYIIPNDINIGGSDGNDGSTANLHQRGNLTTGVFQPVSSTSWDARDPGKYYHTGGPTGYISRSHDYATFSHIDELRNLTHNTIQGLIHISGNSLINMIPIQIPSGITGIVHLAGSVLQGGALPIPAGLQGILHLSGQGIMHIADNALNSIVPAQFQGIAHLAENAISHTSLSGTITHSSLAGAINLVSKAAINIGAAGITAAQFDPLTPPVPTEPTNVNLIGSMSATINISAGGSISGGSMSSGGAPVMTQPIPPELIAAPVTVTGSISDDTATGALKSLLTALVTLGLIVDQTTA